MKCPGCVSLKMRSRFEEKRLPKDPNAPVERFYDEDGAKHVHDHGALTIVMVCSNNHSYSQVLLGRCPHKPCAWNSKPEVLAQEQPIGAKPNA